MHLNHLSPFQNNYPQNLNCININLFVGYLFIIKEGKRFAIDLMERVKVVFESEICACRLSQTTVGIQGVAIES